MDITQIENWQRLLQEASDELTAAEKVEGRTVKDRALAAYRLRDGARRKVSKVKFEMGDVIKEMADER